MTTSPAPWDRRAPRVLAAIATTDLHLHHLGTPADHAGPHRLDAPADTGVHEPRSDTDDHDETPPVGLTPAHTTVTIHVAESTVALEVDDEARVAPRTTTQPVRNVKAARPYRSSSEA